MMNVVRRLVSPSLKLSSRVVSTSAEVKAKGKEKEAEASPKLVTLVNRERSLNIVTLIGRVGTDPTLINKEKQQTSEADDETAAKNVKLAVFSLATSEYAGLDSKGEAKFRVDWHRIVVVSERAQATVEKYVRKGDRIHVTGRLHYNPVKESKTGETKYLTNIIADDFIFLSKNLTTDI